MIVKVEMLLEISDNSLEEIKILEHHVDYLLDLENYPEIKSVNDVKITEVKK